MHRLGPHDLGARRAVHEHGDCKIAKNIIRSCIAWHVCARCDVLLLAGSELFKFLSNLALSFPSWSAAKRNSKHLFSFNTVAMWFGCRVLRR
jgi:hypothetical protein